jgi:hypothetical protein
MGEWRLHFFFLYGIAPLKRKRKEKEKEYVVYISLRALRVQVLFKTTTALVFADIHLVIF